MNFDKKAKLEIIEDAFSYIVVFAMLVYGVGKIVQFDSVVENGKPVGELTGMQLMWAFYSYSKGFALILGVFEITGGILMLLRRTRILGCLFVTTILVNVILQDIFYGVHTGALKAAIIYQLLIFAVLWFKRNKLIQVLKILLDVSVDHASKKKTVLKTIATFLLFVALRILEYFVTIKW